jgi:DNA-directed RNA polymerase subunit F
MRWALSAPLGETLVLENLDASVLCAAAAKVIVTEMAGEGWNAIRRWGSRTFSKENAGELSIHESRLERDRARLVDTPADQQETLVEELSIGWKTRLMDLVEAKPSVADDLRSLLIEYGQKIDISDSSATTSKIVSIADRKGRSTVAGRDMTINQSPN